MLGRYEKRGTVLRSALEVGPLRHRLPLRAGRRYLLGTALFVASVGADACTRPDAVGPPPDARPTSPSAQSSAPNRQAPDQDGARDRGPRDTDAAPAPRLDEARSPAPAPLPSPADAPRSDAAARRRYVVAAIGDSLTDPRSHGGGYLKLLGERCPASRFDNYGVGGQMVNQMRRRFARDVLGEPPDPDHPKPRYSHLLVLGGINDICSDETALRTPPKIRADLAWMYRTARARGIHVVALTMPPWGGFERYYNARREASTLALNAWIRDQARDGAVDAVVDLFPLLSCGRPTHLCERYGWPDRVHWSREGHQIVGEAIYRAAFADCE
jgi:lysophospholipase L1-like esterase